MRRKHYPLFIKKMRSVINRLYINHFIRPQFSAIGEAPQISLPYYLVVYGDKISLGDHVHLHNASDNYIRLTTWPVSNCNAELSIGDYCLISPGTRISAAEKITIGRSCMLAANCYLSDSDWHGIYNRTRPFRCTRPITLEDNVWLGEGVIVCKGVTIGENSIIGAGAVVTRDIPANVIAAGNPARAIKAINPQRRMLTRETMFADLDVYHHRLEQLDKSTLSGNSMWSWLRSLLFPKHTD